MLRTTGTSISVDEDAHRNRVDVAGGEAGRRGHALMLTIDARIQAALEPRWTKPSR